MNAILARLLGLLAELAAWSTDVLREGAEDFRRADEQPKAEQTGTADEPA